MATKDNTHAISDADLDGHRADAEFRMQNVPMRGVSYDLVAELRKLPGSGGYLVAEPVNHLLLTLRRGLCLYYELHTELTGKIDPRQTKFISSYALFALGALVAQELEAPEGENLASFPKPQSTFFTVGTGPDDDLKSLLSFYLKAATQKNADNSHLIESTADLVNLTRDYFIALRDEMVAASDQHPADLLAQVEGSAIKVGSLELRGFAASAEGKRERVEFTPVLPEQVVGNSSAKRALIRYVDRLALYDLERGFNPILELGGLPSTVLFDGFPGTGKTTLFRMAMTRLAQRGEQIGLPARFVTIDPGIKDEYYGRTGKLLSEKLAVVRERGSLVLVFFDDVDLLLLSRGDPGMGGADKDVLNITMQFLDGAFTTHVGNAQTYAATNEPTATDSALRQRFHQREAIEGPESWEDYVRLTQIKLTRQIKHNLVQVDGGLLAPPKDVPAARPGFKLANPFAGKKKISWQELGELCVEFKRKDPRFTGRPIESITQNLLAASADFDIPEEWFADRAVFVEQPYERKLAMLTGLYRPITGEMIAAELEHYFNSEQRYGEEAKTQRAERLVNELEAQMKAREILGERSGEQE